MCVCVFDAVGPGPPAPLTPPPHTLPHTCARVPRSEEEAARAYDRALWRLKPREARSYVNFKARGVGWGGGGGSARVRARSYVNFKASSEK